MLVQILAVADDMVVETALPNVFAIFLVAKTLECGHKTRYCGMLLCCRGRRPRRPAFGHKAVLYKQQNVYVVWHDHVALNF